MFLKTKSSIRYFIIFLSFCWSLIYFRDYILAIDRWFSNYVLSCGDFGQYSDEADTFFKQKYLISFLVPAKEPGYFLVVLIVGKILSLGPKISMIFVDFVSHFLSLLFIGLLVSKLVKNKLWSLIAVIIAIFTYQFSYVFIQLISRQLISTTFLLAASYFYFFPKRFWIVILLSLFLGMAISSHRFWGIIYLLALIFWIFYNFIISRPKAAFDYVRILFISLLFAWPFVYFLIVYQFALTSIQTDPFINETFASLQPFIWWFSYLANSGSVQSTPILHYFFYQPFYLILFVASSINIFKDVFKKNTLFINIFIVLLIFSVLKITFSIRSLVSFEIFLIPLLPISFSFIKNRLLMIFMLFSFFFLWISWIDWRAPIAIKKVIPKDSSIYFIEKNFKHDKTLFLSPIRCESDLFTQLSYFSSLNLGNDNLNNIKTHRSWEILDYNIAQIVAEKNYYSLTSWKAFLHEIFRGKEVYLTFGQNTSALTLNTLKNHTNEIFSIPFLIPVYENPNAKFFKYIFKLDASKMSYFDNGYYLRDLLRIRSR